jgi:hypothetical protein
VINECGVHQNENGDLWVELPNGVEFTSSEIGDRARKQFQQQAVDAIRAFAAERRTGRA